MVGIPQGAAALPGLFLPIIQMLSFLGKDTVQLTKNRDRLIDLIAGS